MTKADRIRTLYAKGHTVAAIAKRVGCTDSYVRVCARQRAEGAATADLNYRVKIKRWYAQGDRVIARRVWKETYHRLRADGFTSERAHSHASRAYQISMEKSGRKVCMRMDG